MAVIEAITTTYLETDTAYVEFSSIPASYEHLQLRFSTCSTSIMSPPWHGADRTVQTRLKTSNF